MKKTAKTIVASLLVTGGVGIWVPQILGMGSSEKAMNTGELPADASLAAGGAFIAGAEPPGLEMRGEETPPTGPLAPKSTNPTATPESTDVEGASPLSSLDKLLGGTPSARSLTDLSSLWDDEPETKVTSAELPQARMLETMIESEGFTDPLQMFLQENALTGIIAGKNARIASFGPYLFREGEAIFGSEAIVDEISARHVSIRRGEETIRVELPPFRTRASRSSEDDEPSSGDIPGEEPPMPAGGADELATPIPAGDSNNE